MRAIVRWPASLLLPFGSSCALFLQGCVAGPAPPNPRSPAEVVARASGTKLSFGENVVPGLRFALAPVDGKCKQESGQLVADKTAAVSFVDRRREQSNRTLQFPIRMVCKHDGSVVWGLDIELQSPKYLIGPSMGDGVFYYGEVRTTYVPPDVIIAEQRVTEGREAANRSAMEAQRQECARLREAYRQRLISHPQPGMKVAYGMIVEVKGAIALVQYDASGRQIKGRDTEWIPVSTLGAGEDCPQ
jgi:hypothetical protein